MAKSRQAVVNLVESWDGKKESNGSHKSIIDLYNDFFEKICAGKFPRGIRMRYDWAWCACTWSALAAALRYESIMPMEISCYYLIEAAKKMGCWQENDAYVPSPGDAILYDWQDNGISDNTGNPDHVGTVIEVYKESGYMVIEEGKLSASLGAITVLFANLLGAMAIFNKISSDTGKVSKACTAMIAMSVAVSILAGALKKVSNLDWGELARGLVGIAGLTTIVVASSKAMASSQKQVMKGATSLIIFGAAIKILASACEDLSKLQWDELGRGLTGVGVLFAEIAVFLRVAKFNGKMISTATGIVILSAAMKVLTSACKDFGQMEWSEIGKGLAGIGGLLAELAVFTNLAGNAKHVMSTGVALIAIGAAMKIFASAVKDFGQLQWDEQWLESLVWVRLLLRWR